MIMANCRIPAAVLDFENTHPKMPYLCFHDTSMPSLR
jgi:hypothetical protein